MRARVSSIEDVRKNECYATCEAINVIGISRQHFNRLAPVYGLKPVYKPERGTKPFWTGADVMRFYTRYN